MQNFRGSEFGKMTSNFNERKEWGPFADIVFPIDTTQIRNFDRWICWNGFREGHKGYDFAAYLNTKKVIVLGLPGGFPVRAVADGRVIQAVPEPFGVAYGGFINIEHGGENSGMFSSYHHIIPSVKNTSTRKGEIIGYLYQNKADKIVQGRIVHLHFELTDSWEVRNTGDNVDPAKIFPEISRIIARPQGDPKFEVEF